MNLKDDLFTVAETKHPATIEPVRKHLDWNHAHELAAELRRRPENRDKQYAIFNEAIGLTEEGMVQNEAEKRPRRE